MASISFTAACPACNQDARWMNVFDEHRRRSEIRIECRNCDRREPKKQLLPFGGWR